MTVAGRLPGWRGGGGPTRDMMERYRRIRDLEGLPRITIESPANFFEAAISDYPDAATWVGELYFEMHRGTYTSQAKTKAGKIGGWDADQKPFIYVVKGGKFTLYDGK